MQIELEAMESSDELTELLGGKGRTVVRMSCDTDGEDIATTLEGEDGTTEVVICQSRVMAQALIGLEEARKAIAENGEMQGEIREEVLRELDQQIKRWKEKAR